MNIAVCVKQVPDADDVRIDPKTNTLIREGVRSVVNPFDLHAVEEGVRIRERLGEGKVAAVSMGPPQADAVLREAISVGADEGILLSDRAFAGADTWATSLTLALAMKKLRPDIVLAGRQSTDGDTAQVGPGIAGHLGIPHVCSVSKIREIRKGMAVVECVMETGKEVLEVELPAVMTVTREINEPRLPSLKGKMRAKKAEIAVWTAADIGADPGKVGLAGSPTAVVGLSSPPKRDGGEIIQGETAAEKAKTLVARIREIAIV